MIRTACFIVRDKNGLPLGCFYFENEPGRRTAANLLTKDEAAATARFGYSCVSKLLQLAIRRVSRGHDVATASLPENWIDKAERRMLLAIDRALGAAWALVGDFPLSTHLAGGRLRLQRSSKWL